MNKMFTHQIGRNVQVYVGDMLVKSQQGDYHSEGLKETFNTFRSYNMKLNPSNCVFGVTAGKFPRIVIYSPERDEIECMVHFNFPTTNNEAEYEALMARLDLTKAAGATSMVVYCDSQVITNQVNDDYECKGERMKKYLEQVKKRVGDL